MKRVTGIGGIFFKSKGNQPQLLSWYEKHLGISAHPDYGTQFPWRDADNPEKKGTTAWSIFKGDSKYFDQPYMINYRVENLDQLLKALEAEGVEIDPKREGGEYGKFAWIVDPEGNRIELWEPAPE